MKSFDVAGVFTTMCFGASVYLLLIEIPGIGFGPSMDGVPWLFVHPLVLLDFLVSFTVLVVWVFVSVHSIRRAKRFNIKLMALAEDNFYEVFLAASSLVVAFSGCATFLRPVNLRVIFESDWTLIPRPIYFFGLFICIVAWVFFFLSKHHSIKGDDDAFLEILPHLNYTRLNSLGLALSGFVIVSVLICRTKCEDVCFIIE